MRTAETVSLVCPHPERTCPASVLEPILRKNAQLSIVSIVPIGRATINSMSKLPDGFELLLRLVLRQHSDSGFRAQDRLQARTGKEARPTRQEEVNQSG